jgi:predicted hotdog family 3-hydroxylacyl-ACP dehydratase
VFNTLPVPPAELGLGTLQGEEQLKSALQSKDRLFLIMVSREMESFVRQVVAGQAPSAAAAIAVGTASTSLLAGHSFRVETSATSKFQRMLVYKAAEWYGLKAVAGTDASIFVGVLGSLSDKR